MKIFLAFVTVVTVMSSPAMAQAVSDKSGVNSALGLAPSHDMPATRTTPHRCF